MSEETGFIGAVYREINGKATREDLDMLVADPKSWRLELVSIQRNIDNELSRQKAASLKIGNQTAYAEFTRVKAELTERKNRVVRSIQSAKELIERGRKSERAEEMVELKQILAEVRALSAKLDTFMEAAE